jgi:hypothetical protein
MRSFYWQSANEVVVAFRLHGVAIRVMKPDQDAFHYHLIYGTRHEKGVEVFKKTETAVVPFMHEIRADAQQRRRYTKTGQHEMFGPVAQYKERKFTEYHAAIVSFAKNNLRLILETKKDISYDDVWAIAMQYPTVWEVDLREWLDDWKKEGFITIKNLKPRQRVPQRDQGHSIEWISAPQ